MRTTINEALYQAGFEDGWDWYEPGKPVACPIGVEEDYDLGWWIGLGVAEAWHEGWDACAAGVHVCPYVQVDDEAFRESWMQGYACAMEVDEVRYAC